MSDTTRARPDAGGGVDSPLDRPTPHRSRALWVAVAVGVHAALLTGAVLVPKGERERPVRKAALISEWMEVQLEAPEPEAPAPEPPPAEPEPPPVRKAPPRPQPQVKAPEPAPAEPEPAPAEPAPAPEAAEAAEVMTAEAPADSSPSVVSGTAAAPVGGASAASGTAKQPVKSPDAVVGGVEGGTGKAKPVDLSRPPGLAGGAHWDCPHPREADFAGIEHAAVILRVKVGSDGAVQSVQIHDDPGHGFGREARSCALRKRWRPALDKTGTPIATTVAVRVRF